MSLEGIIFDIKKYAIHDGPGIRTTVFFKGCPLSCWWCHNPEGQNPDIETITRNGDQEQIFGRKVTTDEVMEEVGKDRIFYDQSGGGVTFSGGEPLQQPEFLTELLQRSKYQGFHTVVDTCGFVKTAQFQKILSLVDLFLYDLKIIDEATHIKYTGVRNSLILKNLRFLSERRKAVHIRVPIIPAITDTEENLRGLIAFLATLYNVREVSLLPFHRTGDSKYHKLRKENRLKDVDQPSESQMDMVRRRFKSAGYHVQIGG